jgi:hypothetical protein
VTVDNSEKFQLKYQAGKEALEKGQYRLSIENLEAAKELVSLNSRRGGEAQIWLVTAYQAANLIPEAVALCQELATHADLQTREQAKRILYIIQAPALNRPKEWMSEIPDLANADQSKPQYIAAKKKTKNSFSESVDEELDLSQVDTKDNQFVWFALLIVIVILGSLVWLN